MSGELATAQRVSLIVMLAYTGDRRLNAVMALAGRASRNT